MSRKVAKSGVPILKVRKGATLREIYTEVRKNFSAADLQKYTVVEEGIPAARVIAEMERIQKEEDRKLQKRRGNKRKA